ncbi:MAG: undecaprenyl diphosphate synthase family protein [Ilumatobacteraceae bacterium]
MVRRWGTLLARRAANLEERGLQHIVVAGGSCAEWDDFDESDWKTRLDLLADVARRSGARFVTVRPYEPNESPRFRGGTDTASGPVEGAADRHRHIMRLSDGEMGITVSVDSTIDGRQRICDVLANWPTGSEITEAALGRALCGDAGEPDLVVVLGPPNRLPRSLVWELAYSELVFVSASWRNLSTDDVVRAVDEFAGRSRRFGGVEE